MFKRYWEGLNKKLSGTNLTQHYKLTSVDIHFTKLKKKQHVLYCSGTSGDCPKIT